MKLPGVGYGSGLNYNSGYGSGTYGSYGAGGSYGGGMYGNSMYRGGMYGGTGSLYGGGMYGGGMYNSSFGGGMGSYGGMGMGMGMGMGGPPYGDQDPNNPFAAPSSPPGFWVSFMHVVSDIFYFYCFLCKDFSSVFEEYISTTIFGIDDNSNRDLICRIQFNLSSCKAEYRCSTPF